MQVSVPRTTDKSQRTYVDYVGSIFLEILFMFIKSFGVNIAQWKNSIEV